MPDIAKGATRDENPKVENKLQSGQGKPTVSQGIPVHSTDAVRAHRREEKRLARRQSLKDFVLRALFLLGLWLLWTLLHSYFVEKTGAWSGALFPSPGQVWRWFWEGTGLNFLQKETYTPPPGVPMPGGLWEAIKVADYPLASLQTLWRLFQSYLLAVAIGVPIGILCARSDAMQKTVGWLALGLQSLPSICWIPLALLWFSRIATETPIMFVTLMGALFATIVSVADGLRNVPPIYARAGRVFGASGLRLYLSVLLPAALPAVVTGLKIGWSFAYRSLMAAELIINAGGLGFLMQRDRDNGDADGVLATILVVLVIGIGVQSLVFAPVERRLQRLWGLGQAPH